MSHYVDLVVLSIRKRHVTVATVSGLLSALIHIAIILAFAFLPIGLPFFQAHVAPETPTTPPIRLQSVQTEPTPPVVAAAEASPTALRGPGVTPGLAELAQKAEHLEEPVDRVSIEPPPVAPGHEGAPATALQPLDVPPKPETWQPRQELLDVERTVVRDELAARERRRIPRIERVIDAPDVVYPARPVAPAPTSANQTPGAQGVTAPPALATILRRITQAAPAHPEAAPLTDATTRSSANVFAEKGSDVTALQPIEGLLSARITTFTNRRDPRYGYFRVEISRRSAETLPVLPKDILFVQDCSASISEQRLYFCRQGLTNSLALVGPRDRFNVVAFRDQVDFCFPGWTTNSPEAQARAMQFVEGLQAHGETDLFKALRAALDFSAEPGRPVIVILITDGHPTTGLTDGAAIIREITKANSGAVSIFTLGTTPQAYYYLLDLLSYSNRGDARVVTSGRWDIPKELRGLVAEVQHPVLADVGLSVAEATPCDVYPVQTMNLYRDRPLVLYGRYPRDLGHVVFQATGRAADVKCDMIFDLDLRHAPAETSEDLRQAWARQKLYHLLGQQARTGDPALIREIDDTSREYQVPVPYREVP